ncbi:hypothetical protein GWI33_017115 [Rhynchophorus ferrugineus]|uniref:Uncharacterized protein n=1 Tax=Rhynchophorus ferrugineus TaxID=354439 RepID=A0A834I2K0_RHYFE|nr:hypothetical protein GWI33_017115 [Rhynchophorus ferrugineus]
MESVHKGEKPLIEKNELKLREYPLRLSIRNEPRRIYRRAFSIEFREIHLGVFYPLKAFNVLGAERNFPRPKALKEKPHRKRREKVCSIIFLPCYPKKNSKSETPIKARMHSFPVPEPDFTNGLIPYPILGCRRFIFFPFRLFGSTTVRELNRKIRQTDERGKADQGEFKMEMKPVFTESVSG